jgi:hypothetical protein
MTEGSKENDDPGEPTLPMTVDSPIFWAEFLVDHDVLRDYYKEHGIKCFDCCAAEAESFAEGAKVHEGGPYGAFDPEQVVKDLNELAKEHPFDEKNFRPPTLTNKIIDFLFPSEKKD